MAKTTIGGACAVARARLVSAVASLRATGVDKAVGAIRTFAIAGTNTVMKDASTKTSNTLATLATKHLLVLPLDVAQSVVRAARATIVDGAEFAPDTKRLMASVLDREGIRLGKQGFQAGLNKAVEAWKTGIDPESVAAGFSQTDYGNPVLNRIMRTPGNLIGFTSKPLFEMATQLSLYNDAKLYAMREGGTPAEQSARVNQLLAKPTDEMAQRAILQASEAVFQQKSGIGELTSRIRNLTSNLGKPTKENPEGNAGLRALDSVYRLAANAMIPVAKVPGAVLTKGLIDLSPAGVILRPWVAESGSKGAATITAIANAGIGAALFAKGYADAEDGRVSGAHDPSRSTQNVTDATGAGVHMLKIGGQWVGIRAVLGAYSIPYIAGAATHALRAKAKGGETPNPISTAGNVGLQILTEETFLENMGRMFESLKQGKVRQAAASLAPVPQILRQVATATAPSTKRLKDGPLQTLAASAVPGYARSLPEAHDIFGRPMATDRGGAAGVAQAFFDPTKARPDVSDWATNELQRLGVGIASTASAVRSADGVGKVALTAQARDALKAKIGPMLHEAILSLKDNPDYQALPDAQKARQLAHIVAAFHTAMQADARANAVPAGTTP